MRKGLTLTELLVVLAILGVMATGIVPATTLLLSKSQSDHVEATVVASWRLALAYAQARGQPVLWQIESHDQSTTIQVQDAQHQDLWHTTLQTTHLTLQSPLDSEPVTHSTLLVYPHGLSPGVTLQWVQGTTTRQVRVPAVLLDP